MFNHYAYWDAVFLLEVYSENGLPIVFSKDLNITKIASV
uniref:Uncharacterized protein n=1 Tax=Salvator merianae TaxID=96440 RepID=A0A8D0B133_SALMN